MQDVIQRHLRIEGVWDATVRAALRRLLKPGDVFVELGANIGCFTLMASRLVGDSGRVIACEPSIRAPRKLTHHVHLNRCRNVSIISMGCAEQPAMVSLALAPESNIGGTTLLPDAITNVTEPVLLIPLDDILMPREIRPTCLKVDIEGFELSALRGAARTLAACHPTIICEVTDKFLRRNGQSAMELVAYLEDFGYRPFLPQLTDAGQLQLDPVDSAIVTDSNRQFDVLFSATGQP